MDAINLQTVKTVSWALAPPTILLTALNLPTLFYANTLTRTSTLALVAAAAASVILGLKIESPSVAFMTGLLECWSVIWASVLLLRFNPTADFARLRWHKAPQSPEEYSADDKVWQRFPSAISLARLSWTLDLLISFRRVGWVLEKRESSSSRLRDGMLTRQAQSEQEGKAHPPKKSRKPRPAVGVLPALLKVAVDYLTLTGVNWTSPWLEQKIESPQLLQALHVATWIFASVPFINFCHSCWMTVGEIGQWLAPSEAYQSWEYNPSPWGPVGAVIEYGLAGLWGATWHNYFKFGFQSSTDLVVPRSANPQLKALLRLAKVFWSFLLSGLIHLCGSYMLPGPTRPHIELLFFILQGAAVAFQVSVFDRVVSLRYRRLLNPILVLAWLYFTGSLMSEDQRAGGMWAGVNPRKSEKLMA